MSVAPLGEDMTNEPSRNEYAEEEFELIGIDVTPFPT